MAPNLRAKSIDSILTLFCIWISGAHGCYFTYTANSFKSHLTAQLIVQVAMSTPNPCPADMLPPAHIPGWSGRVDSQSRRESLTTIEAIRPAVNQTIRQGA